VVQSTAGMSFVQSLEAAKPKVSSGTYGGSAAKRRVYCLVETEVIFTIRPSFLSVEITAIFGAKPAVNVKGPHRAVISDNCAVGTLIPTDVEKLGKKARCVCAGTINKSKVFSDTLQHC